MKNNVRSFRRSMELSQEGLAAAVGVGRHTIMYVEKGTQEPSASLAIRIAEFFGKDVKEVFPIELTSVNSTQHTSESA